jgi:hypothetical protein
MSMRPYHWQQIEQVYHSALEREGEERRSGVWVNWFEELKQRRVPAKQ